MTTPIRDVIIVGAGLSGLATAYGLSKEGVDVLVLEASDTHGGRIQSLRDTKTKSVLADLGPTWVWPEFQPIIGEWASKLDLVFHPQYDEGLGIYEAGPDLSTQRLVFPKQQGIKRIIGGPQALVDRLADHLAPETLQLARPVSRISRSDDVYRLEVARPHGAMVYAKRIVFACPLRISAGIDGIGSLVPEEVVNIIQSSPTWMASHAKVSIVFETPFWRESGLSGRVASRVGPMVEVHDISGHGGTPAALFGFCGVPSEIRDQMDLKTAVVDQLVRCFGEKAASPIAIEIRDWAKEEFICSKADRHGAMSHPQVLSERIRKPYQGNSLYFGVSETASSDPGLIAGALSAASRVIDQLLM